MVIKISPVSSHIYYYSLAQGASLLIPEPESWRHRIAILGHAAYLIPEEAGIT